MRQVLLALLLTISLAPSASAQNQAAASARVSVLILTGESGTDWRWTSTSMRSILEDSGRFDVEIAPYPDATLSDRYNAARFDVFLIDYEGLRWSALAEKNFLELVKGGTGVVAVGSSSRAFPEWEWYHAMLGCTWDDAGGAEPFGPVVITGDGQHQIAEGFGDWPDHQDTILLGMTPHKTTHEVLASAERPNPSTGEVESVPVVVVGTVEEGRVVTSTLGHVSYGDVRTRASVQDRQYQQFLIRACEWAGTGKTSTISRIEPNTLTDADRAAGWKLLFDGTKAEGWGEFKGEGVPEERWSVQGGTLIANPVEGDQVLAAEAFDEFEVELEWRVGADARADVQVVPDGGIVGEGHGLDRNGQSLRILRAPGQFNHTRIVATFNGVEQWLNGVRIATYRMTPSEWAYRMSGGRAKDDPELARNMPLLRVVREHEGAAVWFRNIRIRRIDSSVELIAGAPPTDPIIELFNGKNLEGWTWMPWTQNNRSSSAFQVEDGILVNRSTPVGYLRTDATYGDFELEFDWRMNPVTRQAGRAGLLVRMQPEERGSSSSSRDEMFWPKSIDLRLGSNEAGDLHALRRFPMTVDPRRFNGLIARRMRNMEHRTGEWNHAYVRLERGELVFRINGEVVNAATGVGGKPGSLAIKADGVNVHLRNMTLRPLGD